MTPPTGDDPFPAVPDLVDPAVLTALLHRHGWRRRGGAPGRYSRWTPPDGTHTSLLVPEARPHGSGGARGGYADSGDLLGEALTALARSGEPSARAILRGLSVPGDEIRWCRDIPGTGGAVPWTTAEELTAAARAMLLAGARAAVRPAGYFGRRQGPQAAAFLDTVLLGPVGPAPGGHQLTAYTPVPDGRATATTLLGALQATREAVDRQRSGGSPAAFDDAIGLGVSHELTRALVKLVRGTEGAAVVLGWSPASGPPGGYPPRRPGRCSSRPATCPRWWPRASASVPRSRRSRSASRGRWCGCAARRPRAAAAYGSACSRARTCGRCGSGWTRPPTARRCRHTSRACRSVWTAASKAAAASAASPTPTGSPPSRSTHPNATAS
ncbi:hypothetical protein SAMN05216259_11127 [Actinacidiphila guanduensis]|uniref:Uncharacterized protein n=1 Tax=Actinacidiphila guanduensis TaxID=310781 RepID=A0A1H0KZT6_9ACTN|nr:hypothetical protein SAMN05216259_11127 [Actinacidiphila guanduensis]